MDLGDREEVKGFSLASIVIKMQIFNKSFRGAMFVDPDLGETKLHGFHYP